MIAFAELYKRAIANKGEAELEARLPRALSDAELKNQSDEFYLSNMSRRVFRAGLKHSMVDDKWPAFEKAFHHFDPTFCAMLSEDDVDAQMKNAEIIRHRGKILSIQGNGQFVREQSRESGGFGHYIAEWTAENTVALWWDLKTKGKQLGGMSGPAFLRMVGKDTFLLTRDVCHVLMLEKVIDKTPTAKRDFLAAQNAFLDWQQQSGKSLCEISRIVSCTVNTY